MSILDITIKDRSLDYVSIFIVRPLVSYGHLKLDEFDIKQLADIVEDAIEKSKTSQNLASSFGHYTKNWTIDWQWIASHIIQDNYCIRHANELKNIFKRDIKVYKDTIYKMNFPEFNKLYLTDGTNPDSEPKEFLLSELVANGSNLGRKKEEWKPVIGVTDFGFYKYHPDDNQEWEETGRYYDSSHVTAKQEGYIWDTKERIFKPNPNPPPLTERQKKIRSLIKITVKDDNGNVIYSDKRRKEHEEKENKREKKWWNKFLNK